MSIGSMLTASGIMKDVSSIEHVSSTYGLCGNGMTFTEVEGIIVSVMHNMATCEKD